MVEACDDTSVLYMGSGAASFDFLRFTGGAITGNEGVRRWTGIATLTILRVAEGAALRFRGDWVVGDW